MAIMIGSLDVNPLHLHPNDSNCAFIVSVKLSGVENYRIRDSAMKLALQIKHKMGFVNGSYVYLGHVFSDNAKKVWKELQETYDRIDGSIVFNLLQKINSFKQGGLPVSEYYHKLNSLWREFDILTKLPDCTCDAMNELIDHAKLLKLMQFLIGLDDIYQPIRSSMLTREILPEVKDAFVIIAREESHRGIPFTFVLKLMSILNDKGFATGQANMAVNYHLGWIIDLGDNQHMTNSTKDMIDLVDVSDLKLTVGHPNGTLANITHFGNLKLNNDVILFNVLVISEYTVILLYVHKLIKDSKFNVSFDETKCYVQDLKKGRVMGTGSEFDGLYLFDKECNKSAVSNNSKFVGCYVSKEIWHCRMAHPGSCVCRELAEIIKDKFKLFDFMESEQKAKSSSSLYDDEEGPPARDDSVHHSDDGEILRLPETEEQIPSQVKYGLSRYANHTFLSLENCCFVSNLNKTSEPSSFEEASKDPNWISAMNDEMMALYENDTGYLTDLPIGRKPIGSKWVYRIKYKFDGEVDRYKARLVANGFGQKEGIDYEETFSPIIKMGTIRCLISLAVQNNWNIFQMDVNNVFLYGDLNEEVYMLPSPGFFNPFDKKVCRLKRSLYGLKQAPRQWNHKLTEALKENGFEQSKNDHSLFFKNCTSEDEIVKFKHFLSNKFKIKDLGEFKYFLRIEVLKTKSGLCQSQRKYCLELLHEFGLLACRPVLTHLSENIVFAHKEFGNDKFLVNITNYQRLVGKLIYWTLTRPDISYDVHCLSQHMHAPLKSHFDIALRRFVYGYCVFVNGCLVSWKSKKQATLSKSSAEAEYRSMATATCEVIWIVKIMKDLNMNNSLPAELEKVSSGLFKTVKVDSKDNVIDVLTKALGSFQHAYLTKKFGMDCKVWLDHGAQMIVFKTRWSFYVPPGPFWSGPALRVCKVEGAPVALETALQVHIQEISDHLWISCSCWFMRKSFTTFGYVSFT
ncbi:ribonuclease H-like domain-containing protein [Tanacetum coccineum]